MSNLSRNIKKGAASDVILRSLKGNTANIFLSALIGNEEPATLEAKIEILSQLMQCAEELECNLENKNTFLHWTAIASGFATAAVICGTAALNPIAGFLVAATSASAGVATIGGSMLHNTDSAKVIDKLKRLQIAIKSDALINWACLWGLAGFDLFCASLHEAGTGTLSEFELLKKGKVNPITAAVKLVAQSRGVDVAVVVKQLGEIKSGVRSQLEENIVHKAKQALQPALIPIQPQSDNSQHVVNIPTPIAAPVEAPIDVTVKPLVAVDNFQWVHQVLKMPFRVLTGDSGSGKSTLERFMISKLKEAGYHVVCINTETNPDLWFGVEILTKKDEINEFLSEFVSGIENRQDECRRLGLDEDEFLLKVAGQRAGRDGRVAIFFMEANTFEACGVDADLWANVLQTCLTNIRKWGYTACLTAQSDNQTSVSSKLKGFSARYDEQPRVDCIVKVDEETGDAVSSGRGWLKVKGKKDENPKAITLCNFPKTKDFRTPEEKERDKGIDIRTVKLPKVEDKPKISELIQHLEKSFSASEVAEQDEDSPLQLSKYAALILEWLQKDETKDWIKFRGAKGRHTGFIKFLSRNEIASTDKDDAIYDLNSSGKIEVSDDEQSIRLL